MHTWLCFAFAAFVIATAHACYTKAWTLALIAGGLALWLVPAVFNLNT